jgi:CubicO group peptidase (beta-lactamase class C family)
MTSLSVSRIASMTKSFAAVAALKLRDAGLLDIDAPISSIAPSLKLAEQLASASVRNLMSMRLDLATDDPWADRLLGATNEEIDPYFQQPLLRAGLGHHRCAYSNLSYFLLGRLIAIVSDRPLMEYISHHITTPLGMLDTVWNPSARTKDRIALGYRADSYPYLEEEYYECRSDAATIGGLWSSVHDLAIWLEFLRASNKSSAWESVLRAESRVELSMPYASYDARPFESTITGHSIESRAGYGFGLVRSSLAGIESLQHSGGLPGYGSHMRVDVESGYGVIALGNGTYCPVWTPCADSLMHIASSCGASGLVNVQRVVEIGQRLAQSILSGDLREQKDLFTPPRW